MGNKNAQGRFSARRAATFLAALGALVMSSGVALMVAATPANATPGHTPVNICHATSSDSNPYVFITVDSDSKRYQAHLEHYQNPNKTWQNDGTWNGAPHTAGDPKPDLIEGVNAENITKGFCNQNVETPDDLVATADVVFQDPSCLNGNVAKYTTSGENVTFDNPTAAPGATITVTATADDNASFADDSDQKSFGPHTFGAVQVCTTDVSPPQVESQVVVSTPKHKAHTKAPAATVTPTVVHAGLAGSTTDLRGEQGLALVFAGMVMLLAGGGMGLRVRRSSQRI